MAHITKAADPIDQLDALMEDTLSGLQACPPGRKDAFGILLAITDDTLAPAATAITRALQERRRAQPSIFYVIEIRQSPPETADIAAALVQDMLDSRMRAKQECEMRAVLHVDDGPPAEWPFAMEVGTVATSVVQEARRVDAKLIIMGLNQHNVVGRAIGNDTTRETMRVSDIPILAVRPQLTTLPERVVVAVDFSQASMRAARLARHLMDENGSMHLLFVESTLLDDTSERTEGMRLIHTRGVDAAFEQLIRELEPYAGVTIDTVIRRGNPLDEITRFCVENEPDLVAIGSQSHRFLDRLLLGSVARSITADGRWSTLVTPPVNATRP